MQLGPNIFKVTMVAVNPVYSLLYWAIVIGPIFVALTSLLPVIWAVNKDAAKLLNEY